MAWAGIVKHILSYNGTSLTTPVCTIKGSNGTLSSTQAKWLAVTNGTSSVEVQQI